jgi:hypothetical protein
VTLAARALRECRPRFIQACVSSRVALSTPTRPRDSVRVTVTS